MELILSLEVAVHTSFTCIHEIIFLRKYTKDHLPLGLLMGGGHSSYADSRDQNPM